MKRKLTILLTIISFLALPAAIAIVLSQKSFAADAGSCYAIGSPDARVYCLAKAHKDPGRCYAIQDSATRSQCLAEVRK